MTDDLDHLRAKLFTVLEHLMVWRRYFHGLDEVMMSQDILILEDILKKIDDR